jgi:hypothetical protein
MSNTAPITPKSETEDTKNYKPSEQARRPAEVLADRDQWDRSARAGMNEDPQFVPTNVGDPTARVAAHVRAHQAAAVGTARARLRGGR